MKKNTKKNVFKFTYALPNTFFKDLEILVKFIY